MRTIAVCRDIHMCNRAETRYVHMCTAVAALTTVHIQFLIETAVYVSYAKQFAIETILYIYTRITRSSEMSFISIEICAQRRGTPEYWFRPKTGRGPRRSMLLPFREYIQQLWWSGCWGHQHEMLLVYKQIMLSELCAGINILSCSPFPTCSDSTPEEY